MFHHLQKHNARARTQTTQLVVILNSNDENIWPQFQPL